MQDATLVQSGNSTSTLRITQGPNMPVLNNNSSQPSAWKNLCAVILFCAAMAVAAQAQFTKLVDFTKANGAAPQAPLVQGLDGNFYGTSVAGGSNRGGTAFGITPAGTLTTVRNFCVGQQLTCSELGAVPYTPLLLAENGSFYGTLFTAGVTDAVGGTIVRISPTLGTTKLANICPQSSCTNGANPRSGLIQAVDGNFYGTTSAGANINTACSGGCGTIFKITPSGTVTNLHSFCSLSNCADGSVPRNELVQGNDGSIYGTTSLGGANGSGTVFKLASNGTLLTLHSFCHDTNCADGEFPNGLVLADDGNFYGTTAAQPTGYGTVFKITPAGAFTTLYTFCSLTGCADGATPSGSLIQATDGKLYGTTQVGGVSNKGTIFRITLGGTLTRIYSFAHLKGILPRAGLVQGTDGSFYGTTSSGGTNFQGVVFRLSTGMGAFVKALRPYGTVGTTIKILGNGLTGSTSVTLNGATATFAVVSDTEITATVPTGATTGRIQVVTPSATRTSNIAFHVF